jgi:hypothetical protein
MDAVAAVNNDIYLRRRGKVMPPAPTGGGEPLPASYVAAVVQNLASLGYGFTADLVAACRALSLAQLTAFYQELVPVLKRLRGAHREFRPMHPGFPDQVMAMGEGELYLNALVHYWTGGKWLPPSDPKDRLPLLDEVELTPISLGSFEEFETLFASVAGANTSLSEQDREDLAWFAAAYGDRIGALLPVAIPQKENLAYVAGLLVRHAGRERATEFVSAYCKTATDVLRVAVALSGGDVSLAAVTKFRTFARPERALLLALLDRLPSSSLVEDMRRWRGRWVRLGEKLHPGEHAERYPNAARAFAAMRSGESIPTFYTGVERALADRNVAAAVERLGTRPGDLARRLDHLLRLDPSAASQERVAAAFRGVAGKVSTPVLLQVRQHFLVRNTRPGLRVFFPKGQVAKAYGTENALPVLPEAACRAVVAACEAALGERFAALPPLGRVYVDPALRDYTAPFALRSASKALRTLVRGTRLPLPPGDTIRFFVWWKNGRQRTDIDLSAVLFGPDFTYTGVLSYYNLKDFGGVHSGDVVDAPEGASEFIDVSRAKLRVAGVRYVVMVLNSYTQQPYVELPECFAGWMARQQAGSGEVFEPKTVQDRLDLTADAKIAVPLVIDVVEGRVIWCDLSLRSHPRWVNNVQGNKAGIAATLRSIVEMRKPNLYDLFALHARARGVWSDAPEGADTVFSVANGTPFRLDEIASQYMA